MEEGVTLDVPSFCSLYFFTSLILYFLDLGPVQMASAQGFTSSGEKSSGGGVSLGTGTAVRLFIVH
jgi:hypothetical protein